MPWAAIACLCAVILGAVTPSVLSVPCRLGGLRRWLGPANVTEILGQPRDALRCGNEQHFCASTRSAVVRALGGGHRVFVPGGRGGSRAGRVAGVDAYRGNDCRSRHSAGDGDDQAVDDDPCFPV